METSSQHMVREVGQVRAYSVEQVETFLAAAAAERERICGAVADAHAHLLATRERLAASTALRDRIGTMMLEAQRAVIDRRADVEIAVARIVEAAEAEAEALVASARAEVATLRSRRAMQRATGLDEGGAVIDLTTHRSGVV